MNDSFSNGRRVLSSNRRKGKPKDEVESAQKVVFTWERPDW